MKYNLQADFSSVTGLEQQMNRSSCFVKRRINITEDNDPLGRMLVDYLNGENEAAVDVYSETVEMWSMSGEVMFRKWEDMDLLEQRALALCRGDVLDVGAGSGCHSLYLQEQGLQCLAMDLSPGCIEVMRKRGVKQTVSADICKYADRKFDTILVLMNGLGIAGTVKNLRALLRHFLDLLRPGGQIIADSTDISSLFDDDCYRYSLDNYSGEIDFVMQYKEARSDRFYWLYIDFTSLERMVASLGVHCRQLMICEDGRYLVRIFKKAA